jgi:hypothetical protein
METSMQILKSLRIGAGGIAVLLAGGYIALQGDSQQKPLSLHQAHSPMTMSSPKGADVPVGSKLIRIDMKPDSKTAPAVYRFQKNDTVNFVISVPFDGMLAIHGYTSDNPIVANHELKLPLNLKHTGRFPMHVHSKDGQHIEVAILEIMPD